MDKKEVLEKAQQKKVVIGEMEKAKINKSCWIANIVACISAVILMILLGAFNCFLGLYAVATVCFAWASVFYFCQYFIAKRPVGVLIGGIFEILGVCIMITLFVLTLLGVM